MFPSAARADPTYHHSICERHFALRRSNDRNPVKLFGNLSTDQMYARSTLFWSIPFALFLVCFCRSDWICFLQWIFYRLAFSTEGRLEMELQRYDWTLPTYR